MPNIYIDRYTCNSPVSMNQPHLHDHYEIQFLVKGTRIYFIEDTSYRIQESSIIVVPPHVKHMTSGGAFERYNLNVFPQFLNDFELRTLEKFNSQRVIQISNSAMSEIIGYFVKIQELPKNEQTADYIQCILAYVFFLIDRYISSESQKKIVQIKAPIMIYRIIDYINAHLSESLSLEGIAKHFNCSIPYLRKLFQTHIQQPLYDYILTLRLNKVKNLLLTSSCSITKIAELCGFSSSNYLCLIFKKKEGISPLAYKKFHLT